MLSSWEASRTRRLPCTLQWSGCPSTPVPVPPQNPPAQQLRELFSPGGTSLGSRTQPLPEERWSPQEARAPVGCVPGGLVPSGLGLQLPGLLRQSFEKALFASGQDASLDVKPPAILKWVLSVHKRAFREAPWVASAQ